MQPKIIVFSSSNYTLGIQNAFQTERIALTEIRTVNELLEKINQTSTDLFIFDSNSETELFSLSEKVRTSKLNQNASIIFLSTRKISLENALVGFYNSPIMSVVKPFAPKDLLNTARLLINFKMQQEALIEKNRSLEEAVKENEAKAALIEEQRTQLFNKSKLSALGEMASGMAHEINTPLAIITIRTEQMLDAISEGTIEQMDFAECLKKIQNTTSRIAKIIHGLRTFAREGHGDPPVETKLSEIVDSTTSFCHQRFMMNGVELIVEKPEDFENMKIECRSVEISQVALNLLNNAFDAIQSLEEKWIKISFSDIGDWVKIIVTDSGPGIPFDVQMKMMQPFYTTKEIGKGTGLGLSISKGIIERHNGRLYLDNTSPNTQFVIALPKKAAQATETAA
jgi:C4-dicarboxylate-specific signal transduction histidine kinase